MSRSRHHPEVTTPRPTIYLLLGYPGTGKYTVAQALASELEARGRTTRVVDNHYVNNPVFGLVAQDGIVRLPEGIWDRVGEVRNALLATVETLSPRDWSFVFTNWIAEGEVEGIEYLKRLRAIARTRGSEFVCVRLTCEPDELARRVVSQSRRERMKWTDGAAVVALTKRLAILDPGPRTFTVDNTRLAPENCARGILEVAG